MSMHRVEIFQDQGNGAKQVIYHLNPSKFISLGVRVKNLISQEMWDYDKYHDEFENGKYVLFFTTKDGSQKGTMELDITPNTPAEVYVVFKWSEWFGFSAKVVTEDEYSQMLSQKRLLYPSGYRGY